MTNHMTNPTNMQKEAKFTGLHMALVMVAFFGTIIAVNLTMAIIASKSWTGLVVKNSYVASQKFNGQIALQQQLLNTGWRGELTVNKGTYLFQMSKNQQPISGCSVTAKAKRPVHERQDTTLTFQAMGEGRYQTQADLNPGQWVLDLQAFCPEAEHEFLQTVRFVVTERG